MNVVLIPCFNRPEFLALCLEHIRKAEGASDQHYIFRLDHGFKRENIPVIEALPFSKEITVTPRTRYTLGKQSYNVLSGLIQAAHKSIGLVTLIEDDVLIGKDFFRWHQSIHQANPNLFSSHANLNINRPVHDQGNWDEYYLSHLDYGSIGTCMHKNTILEHIAPHATPAYFRSPVTYVQRTFPHSSIGRSMAEQDGLIRRIQEHLGPDHPTAHPHTFEIEGLLYGPRCYHAGFYGKNRPRRSQKLPHLASIVYSQDSMRNFAGRPEFYADSRPCALELPGWTDLKNKPLLQYA